MKYLHFVIRNERLNFKNSSAIVEEFIKARADHHQINVQFVNSESDIVFSGTEINLVSDILQPFSDYEELRSVMTKYRDISWSELVIDGLVPGSGFKKIFRKQESDLVKTYYSSKQQSYNSQINIFKYKRLKVFLRLLEKIPSLSEYSVEQFMKKLNTPEISDFVLSYGESVYLQQLQSCPSCSNTSLQELHYTDSQPLLGFTTNKTSFYTRCLGCELVFLNPMPAASEMFRFYDEFDREDFVVSTNNPYTSESLRGDFISSLGFGSQISSLDLGGGIGNFSRFLKKVFPSWNVTHSDFAFKEYPVLAKEGILTRALDFTKSEIGTEAYDLITMWEVIEHIHPEQLDFVISNLHRALKPGGVVVMSTPNFDSLLGQAFDFYAVCPPFHPLVLSEAWIKGYFKDHEKFALDRVGYCSDFGDDLKGWMGYVGQTSPSAGLRAFGKFVGNFSMKLNDFEVRKQLAKDAKGSEVIVCLRKR